MKNLFLVIAFFLAVFTANAQQTWSVGAQMSAIANKSKYVGGMNDANALFTHNPYGSGQVGVYLRKTINSHFSLQSGIDFAEFGFSYVISQDYSLTNSKSHYAEMRVGTSITRIPVMGIYNSKLNCRNMRFVAGLGLSFEAIDDKWSSETLRALEGEGLGNTNIATMKEVTRSTNSVNGSFICMVGVEKVFSRGNILSFTFQGNHGFAPIAESTVSYTVNNKDYSHTFNNYGSYGAMTISYYFLPMGTRKMNKAVKPSSIQN